MFHKLVAYQSTESHRGRRGTSSRDAKRATAGWFCYIERDSSDGRALSLAKVPKNENLGHEI